MKQKYRSRQEMSIGLMYPHVPYEVGRIHYTIPKFYIPDFSLGNGTVLELKEYLRYSDVAPYEHLARCNPSLRLIFWVQRCDTKTEQRLRMNFETYVGKLIPDELYKYLDAANKANFPEFSGRS